MRFKPRFCLFILIELQVDAVSLRTLAHDFYYPDVLKHKSAGMSVYEQKDSRKVLKDRLRRFVKKTGFRKSSYLETPDWKTSNLKTRKAQKWREISFYSWSSWMLAFFGKILGWSYIGKTTSISSIPNYFETGGWNKDQKCTEFNIQKSEDYLF